MAWCLVKHRDNFIFIFTTWEDDIKIVRKEMMRKGVDYIRMAQDMDQWWIL
jgi:hypothetical protein